MPSHTVERIRNIALVGHAGAGKTTLFEALLFAGGTIAQQGSVERGTTVSDHDPMEKARGHSISSAIASIDHGGIHLNLIDTPGYPDFRGPTLAALAAVETVAVVVDATRGIEHGTVRMMEYAKARRLARMVVVNKIDAEGANPARLVEELREAFGPECLPINLPAQGGRAVVDCFFQPAGEATDFSSVAEAHRRIIDQVVEINEEIMGRYLEEGEEGLSPEQIHDAFEACLREQHLVPVCFASARAYVGVRKLLELFERLAPSPLEANPPPFVRGRGPDAEAVRAVPDPRAHVLADVFKIVHDPYVGKVAVFRVYQGTVRRDSQLFVDDGRKPFRVAHLLKLRGKDYLEIDEAVPGDIAAVAKIEEIHFDAVLHDSHDEDEWRLKPIDFPQPMFGLAVEPRVKGQEQKLSSALAKLAEEDPCFRVEHERELNQIVMRGLGELHLRVMIERLKERFGVEVETRPPRIAYRETISAKADGHARHKKQTGGAGQFGEVFLRIEPLPRGSGFEFVDEVVGGAIPGQFIPAVEKGVRQVLESGAIAGYPMQDLRVIVYDGKSHPVDSKEIAFVQAGRKAFLDAVAKARPLVLEPIVNVDVTVPAELVGEITGSLAAKRGRINGTDSLRGGEIVVKAQAPLAELAEFSNELKALTAGRGRYVIEFSHYDPVPAQIQKRLVEAFRPRTEED